MSDAQSGSRATDRANKPALPPFGGPVTAANPMLHPATDLRGRKTLPPFLGPIRRGGPLPGAKPQTARPAVPLAPVHATPQPSPVLTPAVPRAPSWDTPAVPSAATAATAAAVDAEAEADPETGMAASAAYASEAEWAPPASPIAVAAFVDEPRMPVETVTHVTGEWDAQDALDTGMSDDVPPELALAEPTPMSAPSAEVAEAADARPPVLPPSIFEDTPLGGPEAIDQPSVGSQVKEHVKYDDISSMFADAYVTPPTAPAMGLPATPRRPGRRTPVMGAPRVTPVPPTPTDARAQMAARIGRRATPVLGSQAITPMHTPVIRRTPMAGAIAAIQPAEGMPTALPLAPLMPTPIAVPVMQDIAASRAVAHALETVAGRIRAGQLVVAGDVPIGDDVGALAAGIAAALAALLGVQR